MILEQTRTELQKQKRQILEEIEVLKAHCRLLSEVMVNARQRVLEEKATMHRQAGNHDVYKRLLHNIYKTEAAILSCNSFIYECREKIGAKEEKLNHLEVLLQSPAPSVTPFVKP
jgi:hypothetical protein